MTISKDTLKQLRIDIDAALIAVAEKHALRSLRAGNCTFSPEGSFVFKVEGVVGGGATKEEQLYDLAREIHPELPLRGTASALIEWQGKRVQLFGANSTLSKILYRSDGKTYQTPTDRLTLTLRSRQPKPASKWTDEQLANARVDAPTNPPVKVRK